MGGAGHLPGGAPAASVLRALTERIRELQEEIAKGERWEAGKPVGVEGAREEYEALLTTQRALGVGV